jgi:hypothetical protein
MCELSAVWVQWDAVGTDGVDLNSTEQTNQMYRTIFESTLSETWSAARALQAMFFVLMSNGYYGGAKFFEKSAGSKLQEMKPVIVPVRSKGLLVVVCGILALHFAAVALVGTLFLREGRGFWSRHGRRSDR